MIFAIVFTAGYVFTYRKMYVLMSEAMDDRDASERALTSILAMLVCTLWPLVIFGYYFRMFFTPATEAERREALAAKEAEVAARARHLDQMERELGLGPYKRD